MKFTQEHIVWIRIWLNDIEKDPDKINLLRKRLILMMNEDHGGAACCKHGVLLADKCYDCHPKQDKFVDTFMGSTEEF